MDRRDWTTIAVVGVAAMITFVTFVVMSFLRVSEYLTFAVVMAFMLVLLVGSYLFVITPQKQREEERDTD